MEELEKALATEFYDAIQSWSNATERSQQQAGNVIGVSDLGHCSEKVRLMLLQREPDQEVDKLAAFLGTWVGAGVEQAIKRVRPNAIFQSELSIELETDEGTFVINGHPDVILPDEGILLDNKTVNGLTAVTSYNQFETRQQQRFQRHLYGWGAYQQGVFGDLPLGEIKVGNVWIDRSGEDHELIVRLEPLSLEVIEQVKQWLSEVVYSYKHDIEAPKEPPRNFCENWCVFYQSCRKFDTDAEGLIDDPEAIMAISLYEEGGKLKSQGDKMQKEAKKSLVGLQGSTGTHIVRWVQVEPSVVPEYTRRGYQKVSITRIKAEKEAKK